jgi:hypothetical protein
MECNMCGFGIKLYPKAKLGTESGPILKNGLIIDPLVRRLEVETE